MEKIPWTQALDEMRQLSKEDKHFSFSHATYNRNSVEGGEVVEVAKAQLRKSLPDDVVKEVPADMLLPYTNEDGEPRMCYKTLILTFNDIQVTFDEQ